MSYKKECDSIMLTFEEIERLSSPTFIGWCFDDDAHGYYVRVRDRFMPKSCIYLVNNDYYAFNSDGYRLINKLALLPYDGSEDMTINVSDITLKELQALPAYAYCDNKGRILTGLIKFDCADASVEVNQTLSIQYDSPCNDSSIHIIDNHLFVNGVRVITDPSNGTFEFKGVLFNLSPDGEIKDYTIIHPYEKTEEKREDFFISSKYKSTTIINHPVERFMFDKDIPSLYIANDCGVRGIRLYGQNWYVSYLCLDKEMAMVTELNYKYNNIPYEGKLFIKKNQIKDKRFGFIYIDNGITVNFVKQLLKSLYPTGVLCIKGIEEDILPKILSVIPDKYSYTLFDSENIPCLAIQNVV